MVKGVVDLKDCLESWPYDAARNIRMDRGVNGREFILVRQPLGLEQYEMDGRPDGRQINGMETVLDFHQARISGGLQTQSATIFELTPEDCAELIDEAGVFYHRLIILFRVKDWPRAERDAAQILCLLDYVRQHARCTADREQLEPWRPHLTRIQTVARAMKLLAQKPCQDVFQKVRAMNSILQIFDDGAPDYGVIEQVLLESVRDSLAGLPALHPPTETSFLRLGDYWRIQYQGHTTFLKSMRGLHCLAYLLRHPGQEFHVGELLVRLLEVPAAPSAVNAHGSQHKNGDQFVLSGLNDGIPILDARAKTEYKRRVTELRQELEEAEQFNDPNRAAKARVEMNVVAQQLAAAIGLGGRDRKTSSEAERARCAVTKRIKTAIQKIGDSIPALGHHLAARIKTGYFCSYNPDPDLPVGWKF
ncbi:MAG: hypothetical protein ABSH48_20855 [Verrucomicrobiota bacterium]|jgi:hypothetical protein